MSKRKQERIVHWDHEGPSGSTIRVESIDHFDARGKRRVYGRGDHFGRLALNMDVWRSQSRGLLVRFWSRTCDVDWYSYDIVGIADGAGQGEGATVGIGEHWVPELLRDGYDKWVLSELPFAH